jgi:hypothetical protein
LQVQKLPTISFIISKVSVRDDDDDDDDDKVIYKNEKFVSITGPAVPLDNNCHLGPIHLSIHPCTHPFIYLST